MVAKQLSKMLLKCWVFGRLSREVVFVLESKSLSMVGRERDRVSGRPGRRLLLLRSGVRQGALLAQGSEDVLLQAGRRARTNVGRQIHVVHLLPLKPLEAVLVVDQVQVGGVLGNCLRSSLSDAMGDAMRNARRNPMRNCLVHAWRDTLGDARSDALRDSLGNALGNALVDALLLLDMLDEQFLRSGSPLRLALVGCEARGNIALARW